MKQFAFPLDRVLDWRRAQVRIEEARLEALRAELRAIDGHARDLAAQRTQEEARLQSAGSARGGELAALDAFQRHVASEHQRLNQARKLCDQKIDAQARVVILKRRDVKLLEKLKQQRWESWNKDWEREITQLAEESHLAQWNR
jgi:flagellar export protein FliJ